MSAATLPSSASMGLPPAAASRGLFGLEYKWLVVIAVIFGVFMSVLDSTVVNIALSKLQAVFGVSLASIQWVSTGYTLALTVSIPTFGYLADRFGTKRIYILSLTLFTLASALCGLSWSIGTLVAARVLQGLSGGALLPLATAQIFAVFPPAERGRASATLGVPVLLAPALGPTLGGYIVQYSSWQLIFFLNVPIGIVGALFALAVLRSYPITTVRPLDVPGLVLSTLGFAALTYGIADAGNNGWDSPTTIGIIGFGLLCLTVLAIVELRTKMPLLDVRLFGEWNFTLGNLMTWTLQIGLFGALFLLPIFLQSLRGLTPVQAGFWLFPSALATAFFLPIGGFLVDRFGAKPVIISGAIALALTSYALSHLTISTTFWTLQTWLLGRSLAISFTLQPTSVVVLSKVPREALARATALFSVMRQVVVAFGTALLSTYVQTRTPIHFAHLAERVTASSPPALAIARLTGLYQTRGLDLLNARAAALRLIGLQIRLQSTILAFRDAFILTTGIVTCGVIIALFLRRADRPAAGPSEQVVME